MKHAHRVLETGTCETCEKPFDIYKPGASGMFELAGEWFGWLPDTNPMWRGYTIVIDQWDRVISTALSPTAAIEGAVEELLDFQAVVDRELEEILG